MGETYTRLYSLPERLYTMGAPVVVAAGALLKDNRNGNIIVQLKIQNIYILLKRNSSKQFQTEENLLKNHKKF